MACGDDSAPADSGSTNANATDVGLDATVGVPVLGAGTHDIESVIVSVIATADDAISEPRDLAFNPDDPTQLWVVNQTTSVTILTDVGTPEQDWRRRNSSNSRHFLSRPAALAFGQPGHMATAPETDEVTQEGSPPEFMGPTLWPTDLESFDAGHGSHLDMLHNSPNAVGIAWEVDNTFWVFDGMHQSLTRYTFNSDHGQGGADHSDGVVERFAEGQVSYVPDVSSHLQLEGDLLYIADTGNNRIGRMRISGAIAGVSIAPNFDSSVQRMMDGASVETLVDGAVIDRMERPSGLELHDGMIFVSDNLTSTIFAFSMDGELLDWLDVSSASGSGSLMGMAFDPSGSLFLTDVSGSRVLRIAVP